MSAKIDCHYHHDASIVSTAGLLASMDAFGVERVALIGPLCPDLELPVIAQKASVALRKLIHRRGGLLHKAGLALYNNTVKGDGTVDLLGKRYEIKVQPRNDDVAEAVKAHPDRFWGWVCVNPAGPVEPVSEIERLMKVDGMVGVKAHPFWHEYPVADLSDAAALCQEVGWPMLIHLGSDSAGDYKALPEKFSKLNVIYAHAGIPYAPDVLDYAGEKDNAFVDLSSSGYVDAKIARDAIRRAGANKVLFGTDGPYFHHQDDRFDYGYFINRIEDLGLADADRDRVMGDNFREMVGK